MTKACIECSADHPLSDFYWHAGNKRYSARCRPCLLASKRAKYAADPEPILRANRARRYGITLDELDNLGDTCHVCGHDNDLHVDHNHETGAVRGLLCHNCNGALGWAKDSPVRLVALAQYLLERGSYG